jgi:CHASE2 domain-containing sensor protein
LPPLFAGRQLVKIAFVIQKILTKPALVGAALAALGGLLLWGTPFGDAWENASYDYLFRFGTHAATNEILEVLLDNDSYKIQGQTRGLFWDRALHMQLLNKLTSEGARLVVFDVFFKTTNNPDVDARLAAAMRSNGRVILAAELSDGSDSTLNRLDSASVSLPPEIFRTAAAGYGVGYVATDTGGIARQHWPLSSPGEGNIQSLAWTAAQIDGASLDATVGNRWLRYYGKNGPGLRLPYYQALAETNNLFHGKIVFVGNWPEKPSDPGFKETNNDKFSTPYTHWTGRAIGGVEIHATTFLNLVAGDWLRRLPAWLEVWLLFITGILIGGGLCLLEPLTSLLVATGIALVVTLSFVSWSYYTNYWFPWLVIAGGQVPCALAWSWVSRTRQVAFYLERYPGYVLVNEKHFGKGASGKVWVVRNRIGELQALKEIVRAEADNERFYEREFNGIKSYMPVSSEHPGLLHIGHVNCNEPEGYFYYVMELGEALDPDWLAKGAAYEPRDLTRVCNLEPGGRLPVRECIRLGIVLLEALNFLHRRGLVHCDIKPSNIIFVNGRPKLADVGLVREPSQDRTQMGTLGYMPPSPEPTGTITADIYAMGMVLYVISTGNNPKVFAELSTTLVEIPEFMRLNKIICKACQPMSNRRYANANEMLTALREAQRDIDADNTKKL